MKKLYLLERSASSYDEYYSCVVCANSEYEAKFITPTGEKLVEGKANDSWTSILDEISCKEIGKANKSIVIGSVICNSFNAG